MCSTCGDFTGQQEEVIQHALKEHFKRCSIPWICPDGDYVTHVRGKMWAHRRDVHGSDRSENLTETCSGSFTDMSPDAFVKMENPRVLRRHRDLSEPIKWNDRKGRNSWWCESPASRPRSEASSSGRAYGDRKRVETEKVPHRNADEDDGAGSRKRPAIDADEAPRNRDRSPDDNRAGAKKPKKGKKKKHDKRREAERNEQNSGSNTKRDTDLYTPETEPIYNQIMEGAEYPNDWGTAIQTQPEESTEVVTSGVAEEEDRPSEKPVERQESQEPSPTDAQGEASLHEGCCANQALVTQIACTRQRIKEGNELSKAIRDEVMKVPQQVGLVVQELRQINQTLSEMRAFMKRQLELANFQLRIQAKLGQGSADAYKAWSDHCTNGGAEQREKVEDTEKVEDRAEEEKSPQQKTD